MSTSKPRKPSYTPHTVITPPRTHKTSLIILHGRGSTAEKFAGPLLTRPVSSASRATNPSSKPPSENQRPFQDHFPHTKLIFPTAPLRRAVAFNRSLTHQWFDTWSLTQPELKQHLQTPGLRETGAYLHELLRQEIEIVGPRNVAVMGLSQGCAASLVATMLWDGEPFGGVVGMCGYLPLRRGMLGVIADSARGEADGFAGSGDEGEDLFERGEEDECKRDSPKAEMVIEWVREELGVEELGSGARGCSLQAIPIFMGHGMEDEKVPVESGRLAAEFFQNIDVEVQWKEYENLGHWYSDEMLGDIVHFLGRLEGWTVSLDGGAPNV